VTRKHFEAVARALFASKASLDVIKSVAKEVGTFNPAFNRARFIAASMHPDVHEALLNHLGDKGEL
tara:strand:- start:1466 stop:1663 length:198 start_codon:yes stop_codon:yes gene_type:complete